MKVLSPASLGHEVSCDHLIIGSGAGAAVAGLELTRGGLDVVMLEEGSHHPTASFTANVGQQTARLYRNGGITPLLGSPSVAFAEGRCIGGTTVINGGLIWRTPTRVLEQWSQDPALQGFTEQRLNRHFETVERNLNVVSMAPDHLAGNLDSSRLHEGARRLGWKSVAAPRAVRDCQNSNLCPTGCPSGAKQSMALSYLPAAVEQGAQLYADSKVVRIEHQSGKVSGVVVESAGRAIRFKCEHLILSAGAIQSPHLLHRSGLINYNPTFQFHLNLKFIVDFHEPVHADNGTIFTTQMQEFMPEGMIVTAANIRPAYVAMPFAGRPAEQIEAIMRRYDHLAICTAMIRPTGYGTILSSWGQQPLLKSRLTKDDLALAKDACLKSVRLFFNSGARRVYLPLRGAPCADSEDAAERIFASVRLTDFEFVSVHAMSSLPLGANNNRRTLNERAQLSGCRNLHIMDASILPSNIGESPQGTIMAFTHELAERYLENAGH